MQWDMAPLTMPQAPGIHVWVARAIGHDGRAREPAQAAQQRAIGRALLRRALKTHWDLDPDRWQLTHTPTGAPMLALSGTDRVVLRCSFAHADGATLCAVGSAARLGADLERIRHDDRHDRLARLVCSDAEWAQLAACPRPGLRSARFLGLWTLKEACAKALGANALASLSSLALPLAGQGARWQRHRFAVGLRHVAALAWQPWVPASPSLSHLTPLKPLTQASR